MALRTWVSGPQREVSGPGFQALNARFQDLNARFQDLGFRPSTRGFRTWLSGPGFQALNARFQDLALRTWVSGPQREVSGPGSQDLGFRTSKALHPTVVLYLSRHFSPSLFSASTVTFLFPRHFSLRPPSLFSASSGHRQTDARTDYVNLYIRLEHLQRCSVCDPC